MLEIKNNITECNFDEENTLTRAYDLFLPYMPKNTLLTIEETDGRMCARFLVRLTYTSGKTGRKITLLAKGNSLQISDDTIRRYYTSQLVLSPSEIGREFSRISWYEKRARQDAFLKGMDKGRSVRVSDPLASLDTLTFDNYA
jgi:hypothetical protein